MTSFTPEEMNTLLHDINTADRADLLLDAAICAPFRATGYQHLRSYEVQLDPEQYDTLLQAACDRASVLDATGGLNFVLVMEWTNHGPARASTERTAS